MISLSRTITPSLSIIILLTFFVINNIFAAEIIDINTAPKEELQKITGVGPVIAQRIIDVRPFSSVQDLIRVNGIGEITLQKIIDQGLAWVVEESSQQYPEGVVINEILPSPEGADAEKEWIEIFNQNSFEVNISGWQITDLIGQTQNYTFPEGSAVKPEAFLLLLRPETKITLNNDGDELRLLRPDDSIADSVVYDSAPNGQSFNRTPSGWTWSPHPTPGEANSIPPAEKTEMLEETEKIDINTAPLEDLVKIVHIGEVRALELISLRPFYSLDNLTRIKGIGDKALEDIKKQGLALTDPKLESPKIDEKTDSPEKKTAAITGSLKSFDLAQDKEASKSLSVFLTSLGLAIFSGIIILILKRKLKSVDLSKKMD